MPAQASLFVRKFDLRLKSLFTVAGIDECSNCEYGVGPAGSCMTVSSNEDQQLKSARIAVCRTIQKRDLILLVRRQPHDSAVDKKSTVMF